MGCLILLGTVVSTVVGGSARFAVPTAVPGGRRRATRGRGGVGGGGRVVRRVLGEDREFRGRLSAAAVLIVPGVEQVRREGE